MAPLASIPEGSNSQPVSRFKKLNTVQNNHTDTSRPRSRVFVASRRHSRIRYQRPDKPPCPKPTWQHKDAFFQPKPAVQAAARSAFENIHTTPEISAEENTDPADSSFDLDAFPVPPSTSSTLSSNPNRPVRSSGSSAPVNFPERHVRKRQGAHRYPYVDGANESSGSSARVSMDSALVDAITRNMVQQIRMSSLGRCTGHEAAKHSRTSRSGSSRVSSQQDAVDRFTRDLEHYAERKRNRTGSSPRKRSSATLRTVSALMPYRSEFETAGLAVTSKDQSNRIHSYITKAVESRAPEEAKRPRRREDKKPTAVKPSQVDGFDDTEPSDSPNTEISFAPSNGMDEWRYAMIDEVPKNKKKKTATGKKSKKHCLSCFDHSPSTATDGGLGPAPKLPTAPVPKFVGGIGPPPAVPPPPVPPQRPPRPKVGLFDPEPTQRPQTALDNQTSTSNALSPKMLPVRKHKDKGKSKLGGIPRRGSPHPRIISIKPSDSPRKQSKSSPTRPSRSQRKSIPHEATSKQYDRTVRQATPLDLKSAVEDAKIGNKHHRECCTRPSHARGDAVDPDHIGICCRSHRGVPSRANARPNIPRRTSSMSRFMLSSRLDYDDREITDRDVLRGLHIAASAACDEEVDAFVRNETGLRIRRFLADLMTLESLHVNPPVDKQQWARQRRADMRKLKQQMRRSREINSIGHANYL